MINALISRDGGFYLFTLRLVPVVPFFIINLAKTTMSVKRSAPSERASNAPCASGTEGLHGRPKIGLGEVRRSCENRRAA